MLQVEENGIFIYRDNIVANTNTTFLIFMVIIQWQAKAR